MAGGGRAAGGEAREETVAGQALQKLPGACPRLSIRQAPLGDAEQRRDDLGTEETGTSSVSREVVAVEGVSRSGRPVKALTHLASVSSWGTGLCIY